jgi:hypothetical protein
MMIQTLLSVTNATNGLTTINTIHSPVNRARTVAQNEATIPSGV